MFKNPLVLNIRISMLIFVFYAAINSRITCYKNVVYIPKYSNIKMPSDVPYRTEL